jgi:hypothetical protein
MPQIEGADLTSVSTEREPYPEQEYLVTIKESELSEDNRQLIIKTVIDEPAEFAGREYWDFINLIDNSGKQNKIGWSSIKRYMEAVFGKGSPEAEASPPDTDVLNGHSVRLYLKPNSYTDKTTGAEKKNNKTAKVLAA